VGSVLRTANGRCPQALGYLFHAAVELVVREEVRIADPVLAVRVARNERNVLPDVSDGRTDSFI